MKLQSAAADEVVEVMRCCYCQNELAVMVRDYWI